MTQHPGASCIGYFIGVIVYIDISEAPRAGAEYIRRKLHNHRTYEYDLDLRLRPAPQHSLGFSCAAHL
jgi:hypothetical protein